MKVLIALVGGYLVGALLPGAATSTNSRSRSVRSTSRRSSTISSPWYGRMPATHSGNWPTSSIMGAINYPRTIWSALSVSRGADEMAKRQASVMSRPMPRRPITSPSAPIAGSVRVDSRRRESSGRWTT